MSHYVYILQCKDGSWYTGYTTDVKRRVDMHLQGKGAKYTRGRGPFELVSAYCCETKTEALQLEYAIKKMSRREKERFVAEKGERYEVPSEFSR